MTSGLNEKTKAVQTRNLVERFMHKLSDDDPTLYYATTSEVARGVHMMIKEHSNRLAPEEQNLVRHLTIKDIEVILGFHDHQ